MPFLGKKRVQLQIIDEREFNRTKMRSTIADTNATCVAIRGVHSDANVASIVQFFNQIPVTPTDVSISLLFCQHGRTN